jgi:cytochrome c
MRAHGGAWDYLALNDFLASPSTAVRGTKMAFAGVRNEQDRVALIAYLRSISPNSVPLPAPLPEAAPAAAEGDAAATTTEAAATPAPAH